MANSPQDPIRLNRYTLDDVKENAVIKQGIPGINEYYEQKLQSLQNRQHRRKPGS